ncbi:MAG: hypothetical protein OXF24_06980 [Hyphomicrobiales bacterium]|nr:hypothetical protein [Hyphomicrobiales bacterium]
MRQIATNQQTGLLRLAAILLPTALLAACGGGGGGGAAAPVLPDETPPAFLISEATATRAITQVGGTAPDDNAPSPSELATEIVEIAQMPNIALLFSEIGTGEIEASRMITCARGEMVCQADIQIEQNPPRMEEQDIETIDGPVLLNDGEGLAGYSDGFNFVMTDEDIPLVQARAAGRLDGVRYEFQGYGGWLDYSAFVIQYQNAMVGGRRQSLYSAYSFGNASNMNPTNARWDGVMVGVAKDDGDIIQGDAVIQVEPDSPNLVSGFFNNIRNLTEGVNFTRTLITLKNIPLTSGTFESDDAFLAGINGSIHGNFYGAANEEVGGIFETESIIGAFGAKK